MVIVNGASYWQPPRNNQSAHLKPPQHNKSAHLKPPQHNTSAHLKPPQHNKSAHLKPPQDYGYTKSRHFCVIPLRLLLLRLRLHKIPTFLCNPPTATTTTSFLSLAATSAVTVNSITLTVAAATYDS